MTGGPCNAWHDEPTLHAAESLDGRGIAVKWATFTTAQSPATPRVGVVTGDTVHSGAMGRSLIDYFGNSPEAFAEAGRLLLDDPELVVSLADVRLHAPVPRPPSIRDFMVFEEHARHGNEAIGRSMDPDWYEIPAFYFTNPAATKGSGAPIPIAPGSQRFDYEAELGAVIGWGGHDVSPAEASDLIAGYCLLIDWSARDLQAREMRQGLGPAKGKDTATSLGPVLVTPDELSARRAGRGFALSVTVHVNDRPYTKSNFSQMYWSFEEVISYAARGTELIPGDVFGSGTCEEGCILELQYLHTSEDYPWLSAGDRVTMSADVLGQLDHVIAASGPYRPLRTA